jgi:IS30 family transposase
VIETLRQPRNHPQQQRKEGDLIIGCAGTAIGTLVERSTRFTILLHLPGDHTADTVAAAMISEMGKLPDHLRRSITWDRGTELAAYARIQTALETTLYFCDPHSPWQRGSNENTVSLEVAPEGLIRKGGCRQRRGDSREYWPQARVPSV